MVEKSGQETCPVLTGGGDSGDCPSFHLTGLCGRTAAWQRLHPSPTGYPLGLREPC